MDRPTLRETWAGRIAFKLPLRLDARALAREAARLEPGLWQRKTYDLRGSFSHNGQWQSLMLRASRGRTGRGRWEEVTRGPFIELPALRRSPGLRRALERFPSRSTAVFLLKLEAGGAITRHTDPIYDYRGRELVPIHAVITTNPEVKFFLNGQPVTMRAGEVWSINTTLPHEVYNMGASDRVHLILHLVWDREVAEWFGRARAVKDDPSRARGAAGEQARRYLERCGAPTSVTARSRESARRAARRKVAVIAQLLKQGA